MPTLFVNCDTLYRRRPRAGLHGADSWEPNLDVVAAMERWRTALLGPIVVWSGSGEAAAEMWRRRAVPHLAGIETMTKDLGRPRVGDVLIDDFRVDAAGTCYQPAQSFLVAPAA